MQSVQHYHTVYCITTGRTVTSLLC